MANPPRQKAGSQPKGLFTSLKSMFGLDSPPPPQPPKPVVRIHKADGEEEHWVPLSLDEVLERKPDAEIHLITLRQFRVAVGDLWPRISNKAILLADATLRQVAGPGCIMKQSQEENFLLSFPKLQPIEGRRRATAAAIALGQKLVGAKFKITGADDAEPAICMASVRAGDLAGADGRLNFDLVEAAAALSRPVGDPIAGPAEGDSAGKAASGLTDAVRLRGREDDLPEWEKIERQRQAAAEEQAPDSGEGSKHPDDMPEWERLRWEKLKAGQDKADATAPASAAKTDDMPEWEKIQRSKKPQELSLELVLMQKERLKQTKSEPEWVPIQKK